MRFRLILVFDLPSSSQFKPFGFINTKVKPSAKHFYVRVKKYSFIKVRVQSYCLILKLCFTQFFFIRSPFFWQPFLIALLSLIFERFMPPSFLKSRFGKFLMSVFLSHLVILSMFTGPCRCSDDLFRKSAPWASFLIGFIFEFGIASYARVCLNLC